MVTMVKMTEALRLREARGDQDLQAIHAARNILSCWARSK